MLLIKKLRLGLHLARGLLVALLIFPFLSEAAKHRRIRLWSQKLLRLCGMRLEVEQHAPLPESGVMLLCNHVSWIDIFAINAWRPVRFVAKAESRTTSDLPYEDLTIGWHHLLRQLEWLSGRELTTRDHLTMPQLNSGDGVDALLVCSTLAEPVRVAVLEAGSSPVTGPLLEGLKRANTRVFHVSAPAGRKDGGWAASQMEALRSFLPEIAILVVGSNSTEALPRVHQVVRDLRLAVDRDLLAAGQAMQVDAMARALEEQLDALVRQPLGLGAGIDAGTRQQVHRDLLQHAGADTAKNVGAGLAFDDDVVDAGLEEQLAEQQPGRARADDGDLGTHECLLGMLAEAYGEAIDPA